MIPFEKACFYTVCQDCFSGFLFIQYSLWETQKSWGSLHGQHYQLFCFFFFSTKQLLFFYSDISEYKLYSISLFPLHFSLSCYFASWNVLYAAYLTTFAFRETVYTLWSLLKQCNTIVIQSLVSDLGTLGVRNSESSLSMSLDGDSSESFIRIRLFLQTLL